MIENIENPPLLSILIPVYNVENYLEECIDSVLEQTYKNLEVIVINDGSTDKSVEIIENYQEKDDRIKVINKANSGYGDSMNAGLRAATGEYVGVVESDDFVDLDMFEDLMTLALSNKADVVKSAYNFYYTDLTPENPQFRSEKGGIWNSELRQTIKQHDTYVPVINRDHVGPVENPVENEWTRWILLGAPSIWSAVYRRDFLAENSIWFLPTPGASFQDTSFAFKVFATAKRAVYTDRAYLHYRQDNISSSINDPKKVFCVQEEYQEIERFIRERGLWQDLRYTFSFAKFGCYLWNYNRLSLKYAEQFLSVFHQEFSELNENGDINWYYWDETQTYLLQEIIDNPQRFLLRKKAKAVAKVSVIVPLYNAEKYIAKCLDSLINQTMPDIEIIIVNDASSDNSIEIAEKYYEADPRIQLISLVQNVGQSTSRNIALIQSEAPYIMFCDADDYYDLHMCERMYTAQIESKADFVVCSIKVEFEARRDAIGRRNDRLYYQRKAAGEFECSDQVLQEIDGAPVNKIFSRAKINQCSITFPDGLKYEDYHFAWAYFLFSRRVLFLKEELYHYVRHEGSTMSETFSTGSNAFDHIKVFTLLSDRVWIKYRLIEKRPSLFLNEFRNMMVLVVNYLGEEIKPKLRRYVRDWLEANKRYLTSFDTDVYEPMERELRALTDR